MVDALQTTDATRRFDRRFTELRGNLWTSFSLPLSSMNESLQATSSSNHGTRIVLLPGGTLTFQLQSK